MPSDVHLTHHDEPMILATTETQSSCFDSKVFNHNTTSGPQYPATAGQMKLTVVGQDAGPVTAPQQPVRADAAADAGSRAVGRRVGAGGRTAGPALLPHLPGRARVPAC